MFFSLTKEPSEMTSKEFECSLFIAFSSSVQELDESIDFYSLSKKYRKCESGGSAHRVSGLSQK